MLINPLCTVILLINTLAGDNTFIELVASGAIFVSICFSLYFLVLFYQILHKELAPYSPLLKFLSIKGVLFFTYWQELLLQLFSTSLGKALDVSPAEAVTKVEAVLVNSEMVILSIMTAIAFSYKDFADSAGANSFFRKADVKFLANKFGNVITDNFLETMDDMKEFAGGYRSKSFTVNVVAGSEIQKSSFNSTETNSEESAQKAILFEQISIIPNSLGNPVDDHKSPDQHYSTNVF